MAEPVVADNAEEQRYEISVDGAPAGFAEYEREGGDYALVHTEIDDAFSGRGLGSALVAATLSDLRTRGIGVLPYCPFVRRYLDRHPEFVDAVPAERRPDFDL